MRDLVFTAVLLGLLPLVVARPFVGVILWSWISFMNPHQTMWGFATTMPWAQLVFLATLLGCVVAGEPRRFSFNFVAALMALFLACVTVTSYTALGDPVRVWDKWEAVTKVVVGLLVTTALVDERRRIHALVWAMVISVGYFGVRGGVFTLVTGGAFIVLGPPNSIISDRNHLAAALLVTIPLMNYLRLHSRHRPVRQGMIAAMVLSLFAVVGSQSRGALVGLAATGFVFWLRSRNKVMSGVAVALALALVVGFMPDSWWQRMDSIETYEEDASAMGRVMIWMASLEIARLNPLTGGGFYAMYNQSIVDGVMPGVLARAAHSIWFEVLGEHGFPTLFVWMSVIVAGTLYSMRVAALARGRPDLQWAYDLARMSQVSVVAYVVAGSFLSLSYWDQMWTLLVLQGSTHAVVAASLRDAAGGRPGAAAPAGRGWRRRAAAPQGG